MDPGFFVVLIFFFFNDTATTEIYTLSLHDALPIPATSCRTASTSCGIVSAGSSPRWICCADRKSTRLNSSHQIISYAVFCLKKKNGRRHPTDLHVSELAPLLVQLLAAFQTLIVFRL